MSAASRRTAIILFIARFFKLFIAIITMSVSARFFGVGTDREVWLMVFNFVSVLNLALWGPLNETFRAQFIFLRANEGEPEVLKRTSALLNFTLLILAVVAGGIAVWAPAVAHVIAPAYAPENLAKLSLMLRYMLFSTLLTQATQLLSSILNTYSSFYIPELIGFISAVINLILVVTLSPHIGIYSFVVSNYVSLLLLLIVLVIQVQKTGIAIFRGGFTFKWKLVQPFILYSIPFFLPYIVGQANGLAEKSIANMVGAGTVAAIDYAKKIPDALVNVLSGVLVTIMVPVLSGKFADGKIEMVVSEFKKYVQLVLVILTLTVPILVVCAPTITNILYNKGNISGSELTQIGHLLLAYAVNMIALFSYLIFGLLFLSVNKSKQYALYGVLAQLLIIVMNFALYRQLGVFTFVISSTIAHFTAALFMAARMPFPKGQIFGTITRYTGVLVTTTIILLLVNRYFYSPVNPFANLVYNLVVMGALIGGLSYVFRLGELEGLRKIVTDLKKKV